MERLSHDLNLALEESNSARQGRRKFGLRRRTRSTGNIPTSCVTGITEDGSSSSPPQPPIITQALSDSDDPQLNQLQQTVSSKTRAAQFSHIGNIESDSFNENFSPSKPPNARRKRKFKKMAIDYSDSNGKTSPTLLIGPPQINLVSNCSVLNVSGTPPLSLINKKKRIFKHTCQDAYRGNIFSGKRKWSHRERNEIGEMRERSFSGGCSSKSYYFSKGTPKYHDFKNKQKFVPLDKVPKFKDKHMVVPAKSAAVKNGIENALQSINLSNLTPDKPSLPGSSTFNFVYRNRNTLSGSNNPSKSLGIRIATELPPFFNTNENNNVPSSSHKHKHKSRNGKHKIHYKANNSDQLRNPLQFDDSGTGMDCVMANDFLSSSSLSSSDSEGVVTNDSDREGDDELTDWPGNEEISSFNRSLNLKGQKPTVSAAGKGNQKKDKYLPKLGLSSCKNKTETVKTDLTQDSNDVQLMDDDTLMSDSESVLDTFAMTRSQSDPVGPPLLPRNSFTSFSDVKNAGLLNNNVNEAFFQSFQTIQDKMFNPNQREFVPRSNFSLQKTSSSDLNLSEKSPQSDHCYGEHPLCFASSEIREIRAGCRRVRDERPGFTILSAANEQLSKFLRDPCQDEVQLPLFTHNFEENEKLSSLAKLYSLELRIDTGTPVLKKTINTTQAVMMDQSRFNRQKFLSDYKRRCYGNNCGSDQMELHSLPTTSDMCHIPSTMAPDVCVPSSGNPLPNFGHGAYSSFSKNPVAHDLTASQDLDQGFSEPNPQEGCSLDMENDYRSGIEVRPDLLSHIPSNQNLTDSSSVDLAELD